MSEEFSEKSMCGKDEVARDGTGDFNSDRKHSWDNDEPAASIFRTTMDKSPFTFQLQDEVAKEREGLVAELNAWTMKWRSLETDLAH